jgi:hypothetical protein
MRSDQEQAFKKAAQLYGVYVLVRRTNLASLRHIGDPMCVPKRLDCKAKTADADFVDPKYGPKDSAGLVVDPMIAGAGAFHTKKKYESATKKWKEFSEAMIDKRVATYEGQRALTYVPNGGFYFVDLNPASPRYGCLKFTITSVIAAGRYVHGDFDLYGIVRANDPVRNVAVTEQRLGQLHARSPEFFDVQHCVNRELDVPMVQHGAQESHDEEHSDEGLDIFHPDGTVTGAEDVAAIKKLYATVFKGRRLFTRGGQREVVRGLFVTPA